MGVGLWAGGEARGELLGPVGTGRPATRWPGADGVVSEEPPPPPVPPGSVWKVQPQWLGLNLWGLELLIPGLPGSGGWAGEGQLGGRQLVQGPLPSCIPGAAGGSRGTELGFGWAGVLRSRPFPWSAWPSPSSVGLDAVLLSLDPRTHLAGGSLQVPLSLPGPGVPAWVATLQ